MIDNGINVKVINTDKFKTICIAFLLRQSLDRKYVTYNSILSKILTMGCEKYKTIRDINIKIEEMYGAYIHSDILKKGDNQIIEVLIEFSEDKVSLEEAFLFLKEIILNPLVENEGFKKEYFEKSKQLVIDTIYSRQNDKKELAKDRCLEIMCKDEKFGILADGYIEDIENNKIDNKNLYMHYKDILKTSNMDIVVIGNIQERDVNNLVKKHFNIEERNCKNINFDFVYKDKIKEKNVIEKFNITQGKLCMAFRTNVEASSKDFIGLLVGNEILGGGSGSMLFNNVREKEGLCYYINSFILMFKGIVFIQSGVDFDNYEKAINNIKENVENVVNGNFDDNHIQVAISSLCKKYKSIVDYNTSTIDYYYTNYLANVKMNIDEILDSIKSVKKEDIQKSFKNIWLDTCYFMKGDEN
ncbi:EF-P 5-aminopentanol modification-associated protein YfmF [[Clostridium] colinum]|uniref:EF-P 5-aminopentanol modification-associated protein YfmF n=1 Tax=[Clostridium] colinum TaxID=36835 RepID=UPI0020258E88|nr:pitrilysin family protein [[Clostridium] colinum]